MPCGDHPGSYQIDLHVHTRRYSPCAELLSPDDLAAAMRRRGIQGVVITEHDALWAAEDIDALNRTCTGGQRIYRGIEVSCDIGHFVVIGLPRPDSVSGGMSVNALVAVAADTGAAVIAVHPHRVYRQTGKAVDIMGLPEGIHAVEILSTLTRGLSGVAASRAAKHRNWRQVAGSDAHCLEQVGAAVTLFDHLPANEAALAKAIRSGSGTPLWNGAIKGCGHAVEHHVI